MPDLAIQCVVFCCIPQTSQTFYLVAFTFWQLSSPQGALLPWCLAFLRFPPQWHLLTSLTCVPDVTVACRPHSTSLTYLFILLWYPLLSSAQVESCWLSRRRLSGYLSPPPCLPLSEPSHMLFALLEMLLLSASHKGLLLYVLSHFEVTFPESTFL